MKKTSPEFKEYQEIKKAFQDALVFGNGRLKVSKAGRVRHIPYRPGDVIVTKVPKKKTGKNEKK